MGQPPEPTHRITRTTTQSPDCAHVGTNHSTHPFKRDGVLLLAFASGCCFAGVVIGKIG